MAKAPGDRISRILSALLLAQTSDPVVTRQLCLASVELLVTAAAAVVVMDESQQGETICASNDLAEKLTELEFALGEGPGSDSHRFGHPVLEPDLRRPKASRWPGFAGEAIQLGIRAAFAFPLQLGAIRLGALTIYCAEPGDLGTERMRDSLAMARISTQAILALQAEAPSGTLHPDLTTISSGRPVVHQATGMIAAQLRVPIGEAFVRLQARAYAESRPIRSVATDVVGRRLRFDDSK